MANQRDRNGINKGITWCDYTANLWWGCTEVHAGCDNCYDRVLSHRWGQELWGNDSPRRAIKSVWKDLDRYQKMAAAAGEIHRVFVGSMMDIFEKPMPLIDTNGKKVMINVPTDHGPRMMPGRDFSDASRKGSYLGRWNFPDNRRGSSVTELIPWAVSSIEAPVSTGANLLIHQ